MKRLLLLSILFCFALVSVAQEQNTTEADDDQLFSFVEKMPEYPGGIPALSAFLSNNIHYPEEAINKNITGTVLVEFVVEKDGSVSNVKAKLPLFPACDAEAVRVISMMPKWTPGEVAGKPVRVSYNIPIKFQLQGDAKANKSKKNKKK